MFFYIFVLKNKKKTEISWLVITFDFESHGDFSSTLNLLFSISFSTLNAVDPLPFIIVSFLFLICNKFYVCFFAIITNFNHVATHNLIFISINKKSEDTEQFRIFSSSLLVLSQSLPFRGCDSFFSHPNAHAHKHTRWYMQNKFISFKSLLFLDLLEILLFASFIKIDKFYERLEFLSS